MSDVITNARTTFFTSREEYLAYRAQWKSLAHSRSLTAADMAEHCLLLGKSLFKSFSPSDKAVRGGQAPYITLIGVLSGLELEAKRFTGAGTTARTRMLAHLRDLPAQEKPSRLAAEGAR
ncbi:hypothetical protein F6X40_27440 [Paraburkholderia sp. UCT31]|uniref:hypothetical protein n=1 Tax=Paraburkholderia sp. UCT31 TaxID=2615209 RepID=UPI0016558594|nr:hypothetical protein [Paraburkholderia sp. UCT31]MBC8740395.1 hypothetical protein [Paraburkholderia sp. UCT31]